MCLLPQKAAFAMLPGSQQQEMPVHIKLCASHHISSGRASMMGAGIHLRPRLEPISKRYAHRMKMAPVYPASSPSSIFCPSSPASCIPQIRSREAGGNRKKDMSSGDHQHPNDRGLEEMTSQPQQNSQPPQPTCF